MQPNESIFRITLRAFWKGFAVILGIGFSVIVLIMGIGLLANSKITLPEKPHLIVSPDAEGNRSLLSPSSPVILHINIEGVIGTPALSQKKIETILLDAQEHELSHGRVRGILLYINSPGGSAIDSYGIYHALKSFKEKHNIPIYAYVEGICASGGMYAAATADKVYASPDSIIGSVGARIGPVFNFSKGMEKIGVDSLTLTAGEGKDGLNPFRPWKEGEGKHLQEIIDAGYENFVNLMTQTRPIDRNDLINLYGANVFDGVKAAQIGFIDVAESSYQIALQDLVSQTTIEEGEKYQVFRIQHPHSIFQDPSENSFLLSGKITHSFDMGNYFAPELQGKLLYLYEPGLSYQKSN